MTAYTVFTRLRTRNQAELDHYAKQAASFLAGHEIKWLAPFGRPFEVVEGQIPALDRRSSGLRFARHNPHRGRACSSADHWTQVRATTVLRSVRFVDAVAGGAVDRLEGNVLCHPGGDDSPRLLLNGRLIPTGLLPVVSTHVEGVINYDGPNPCRRAVRLTVFAKWRNVQVIGLCDLAQFLIRPCFHRLIAFTDAAAS